MRPIKLLTLSLSLLAVQGASGKDWEVFGLRPNMSIKDAAPVMAAACASKIDRLQPPNPVENLDIRICRRPDGASLEVWYRCGKLLSTFVSKQVESGGEAMRALTGACLPPLSIDNVGVRRISLRCAEGGTAAIEFPEVGERLALTLSYVSGNATCP